MQVPAIPKSFSPILDGGISFETVFYIVGGILAAILIICCGCFWLRRACSPSGGHTDVKMLLKRLGSLQEKAKHAEQMKARNGAGILKNANQIPDSKF